jgi:ER membrane protein SH3
VIFLGLLGFVVKLHKPSESNVLFDGASLVLYMIAVIVYITNIVKGLRIVTEGTYGEEVVGGEATLGVGFGEEVVVGRVESLRVLAASNTILALVLVGVLVLQAGQWYAERKEADEVEKLMKEEAEGGKAAGSGGKNARRSPSIKKKQ